jgi:hypothetical protein
MVHGDVSSTIELVKKEFKDVYLLLPIIILLVSYQGRLLVTTDNYPTG